MQMGNNGALLIKNSGLFPGQLNKPLQKRGISFINDGGGPLLFLPPAASAVLEVARDNAKGNISEISKLNAVFSEAYQPGATVIDLNA